MEHLFFSAGKYQLLLDRPRYLGDAILQTKALKRNVNSHLSAAREAAG